MKKLLLLISPVLVAGAALAAADAPHVSRAAVRSAEKVLEMHLAGLWPDTPLAMVGHVRGVYLDGYGTVFTAEMNLANEGISLMNPVLTPQGKDRVHKTKIQRVPQLKAALEQALVDVAPSLEAVPLDEQIVLEVVLDRFEWEETGGYPAELLVQSTRRKLMEVKQAKGAGMELAIRATER